jgi:hypothetical protein
MFNERVYFSSQKKWRNREQITNILNINILMIVETPTECRAHKFQMSRQYKSKIETDHGSIKKAMDILNSVQTTGLSTK